MTAMVLALAIGLQDPGAKPAFVANSPEEAFRVFILAMMTKDEAALRTVTVPTDDMGWLLKGRPLPKGQIETMRAKLAAMRINVLKAGDTYTLPDGKTLKVGEDEIGEDRAVILPLGAPMPSRCRKVDGTWRVDAAPIIAGRKAADAVEKKAAAEASQKKGT